jgi:endonuclease YncB( thermonuclease family)
MFAGDSLYGKVTKVKTATVLTFNYGDGELDVRLTGVIIPRAVAEEARSFVVNLVLNKPARIRFGPSPRSGLAVVRVFTNDPIKKIQDVGLELVRAGLARGLADRYNYKGELLAAEDDARTHGRGLWGHN